MWNTLRHILDDDELWFSLLRDMTKTFKYQTVDAEDIFNFVNEKIGIDFSYLFDQYLKQVNLPQLDVLLIVQGDSMKFIY